MAKPTLKALVLLAAFGVPVWMSSPALAQPLAGRRALVEFRSRVDSYVVLRNAIVKSAPPTTVPTVDVSSIEKDRARFVRGLRSARAEAVRGDIFTQGIAAEFRRLLFLELGGQQGAGALRVMDDDAPDEFALGVNESYPDGEARGTMSPGVLRRLPPLPASLRYLFVGPHLILFDVAANMIVDFISDAIRFDPSVPFRLAPAP